MARRKILSRRPKVRKGADKSRVKYEDVREYLIRCLRSRNLTFPEMVKSVQKKAKGFPGSIPWYTESIRLDLEAREIIEKVPGTKPERYRLKRKA